MPLTFSTLSSATTVGCTITLLGCTNAGVSGFFKSSIKILPFSPEPYNIISLINKIYIVLNKVKFHKT